MHEVVQLLALRAVARLVYEGVGHAGSGRGRFCLPGSGPPGRCRTSSYTACAPEIVRAVSERGVPPLPRLAIRLHGGLAPAPCAALPRAAEDAGPDPGGVARNPLQRGVPTTAAATASPWASCSTA